MAAGLATLRKLQRESPYAELEARTRQLATQLHAFAARHTDVQMTCQTAASLFWICLDDASETIGKKPDDKTGKIRSPAQIPAAHTGLYPPLFHALLNNGIYLPPSPWEVGFLSTAHDTTAIDTFLTSISLTLTALADH
jgi:glutamate-1-semialdehyde 2,1-aminomutase